MEQAHGMADTPGDEPSQPDRPAEMFYLPTTTCPGCANRDVVVQIELGSIPVLTCISCGRTSTPDG